MIDNLPTGWVQVRLDQVADVRLGRQRSPDKATGEHMRPYMRAANVTWTGVDVSDIKEMNFSPKEFPTYELRPGDILLSEASGSASEVGKPAIWRGEIAGCCFQNTLIRVRSRGPLPEYLHLHFFADARLGRFATAGKGIGINHLGADRMSSWPTHLPPLNEQRRIVAKLEALQARRRRAREALDAVPPLLEKLRQSILAAAFRGDLTKDWRATHKNTEPATELLERIRLERREKWEESQLAKMKTKGALPIDDKWKAKYVEPAALDSSDLPELPPSWCWARAEEVCAFITKGTTPSAEKLTATGAVPFIKVYNLTFTGAVDFSVDPTYVDSETHRTALARSKVVPGDVLMNIVGPPLGKVGIVPDTYAEWNMNQAIAVFRALPGLSTAYLAMHLLNSWTVQRAVHQGKATAGQLNLTLEICRDLPIPLPPQEEQLRIAERASAAIAASNRLAATADSVLTDVNTLERAILSRTFRGELVPQDPDDEPAKAMLNRLAATDGAALTNGSSPKRGRAGKASRAEHPKD